MSRESSVSAIELARKGDCPETEADRGARRHRGGSADGPEPARPQRHDIGSLCPCLVENPAAQLSGRHGCFGGVGKCTRRLGQLCELALTTLAMSQVSFVTARVLGVEGVERVRSGQVV